MITRWRIRFCCKTCGKWDVLTPTNRLAARFPTFEEARHAFARAGKIQ